METSRFLCFVFLVEKTVHFSGHSFPYFLFSLERLAVSVVLENCSERGLLQASSLAPDLLSWCTLAAGRLACGLATY